MKTCNAADTGQPLRALTHGCGTEFFKERFSGGKFGQAVFFLPSFSQKKMTSQRFFFKTVLIYRYGMPGGIPPPVMALLLPGFIVVYCHSELI